MKRRFTARLRAFALRFLVPRPLATLWYLVRFGARVSPRAEVELSPHLRFGRGCTVSSFTKVKASWGPLHVGERTGFGSGCFLSSGAAGIRIGRDVLVGPNVSIVGASYVHAELNVPFEEQGTASKGVTIGNNVWIGASSVVTDGAVIGDNTIVVAGSLVGRRYPPNVILQGSPARVILRRDRKAGGEERCETSSTRSSGTPSTTSTASSATKS